MLKNNGRAGMKKQDFDVIESWDLKSNPFKSVNDYSVLKNELRWLNLEHRKGHLIYYQQRLEGIKKGTFDDFYVKNISYDRWKYSMLRKAWYIIPLGWGKILENGNRILDLGCGDGDTIQRLMTLSANYNLNKKLHFIGIDSNKERIKNAKKHVKSPSTNIKCDFCLGDTTNLKYPDKFCDYSLCVNVLELLDNKECLSFLDEMCRVTKKGIYVVDLLDEYPGGFVRPNLDTVFRTRSFTLKHKEIVLSEPFHLDKLETLTSGEKPLPLFKVQVLFFTREL